METMNSRTLDRTKGLVGVVSVCIKSTGGSKDSSWRDIIGTVQYAQGILVLTITSLINREHFGNLFTRSQISMQWSIQGTVHQVYKG